MSSDAVIVFAKSPVPGRVKTRLHPMVSAAQSARLYEAFMRDIFVRCDSLSAALRVYVAPPAGDFPRDLLPEHATVHEQEGNGLGARMHRAFEESFDCGYERAVIIGTDHPTLSVSVVQRAHRTLRSDGVDPVPIGPSTDGGYYLLGLSSPCQQIFNMTYSHANVLAQTLRAVVQAHRLPVILPTCYDIDRPADLRRLHSELQMSPHRAPHTYEALQLLDIEFSTD